jgi:hypothetical protein
MHGKKDRGTPSSVENGEASSIQLQSWTQNGKRRFWIVDLGETLKTGPAAPPKMISSPTRLKRVSEMHLAERERALREEQNLGMTEDYDDPLLVSNWMRRTGWAKIFSGLDRMLLVRLTQPPCTGHLGLYPGERDGQKQYTEIMHECHLVAIGAAIDRFFDNCEDTVRNSDHSLRCWLRSQNPGRAYKALFELPARKATQLRYRGLWKRLIYFCIRVYVLQEERLIAMKLHLSPEHHAAVKDLWMQAQVIQIQRYTSEDATGNADPTRASPRHGDSLKGNTSSPSLPRTRGTKQFLSSSVVSRAGDNCAQLVSEESWSDHGDADDTVDEYASEEDDVGSSEDEPYQSDICTTETAVSESFIARAAASPDALLESVARSPPIVVRSGYFDGCMQAIVSDPVALGLTPVPFSLPTARRPESRVFSPSRVCLLGP